MNDPTKPVGRLVKAEPHGIDLQDVLLALGFLSLTGGVAAVYWPAALILAGLIFFTFALLIERARKQ